MRGRPIDLRHDLAAIGADALRERYGRRRVTHLCDFGADVALTVATPILLALAEELEQDGGTTLTAAWAADVLREYAARITGGTS